MLEVLRRFRRCIARSLLQILALIWLSTLVQPCALAWQPETPGTERHGSGGHCCCQEATIPSHGSCGDCSCPEMRSADILAPDGLPAPAWEPPEVPPTLQLRPPQPPLAADRLHTPVRPAYARTPSRHPALRFQRLLT